MPVKYEPRREGGLRKPDPARVTGVSGIRGRYYGGDRKLHEFISKLADKEERLDMTHPHPRLLDPESPHMQKIYRDAGRDSRGRLKATPTFKHGGKVKQTGLAVVHKGEYVVPAKKAGGLMRGR
jgi:hypothetical protein